MCRPKGRLYGKRTFKRQYQRYSRYDGRPDAGEPDGSGNNFKNQMRPHRRLES